VNVCGSFLKHPVICLVSRGIYLPLMAMAMEAVQLGSIDGWLALPFDIL